MVQVHAAVGRAREVGQKEFFVRKQGRLERRTKDAKVPLSTFMLERTAFVIQKIKKRGECCNKKKK
jgi:hypothetical protein